MKLPVWLDRRRFLQMMGGMSLLGAVGSRFGWAVCDGASTSPPKFAYIGGERGIHVYSIAADGRFIKRQTIASAHPVAMAISSGNLYVANRISEYGNLPRGSVEAFAIDAKTGLLELKNRLPLSLSGILPQDLAVAPDGRSVVVAVHGGGAYNVLSVDEDGSSCAGIGNSERDRFRTACIAGVGTSFGGDVWPSGRVLTADQGSDELSLLSINEGQACGSLAGVKLRPAAGRAAWYWLRAAERLYVAHSLNGSVSSIRL